jgi:hypothetical protein
MLGFSLANIPFSGRPEEKYVSHSSLKVRLDTHFNPSKQIIPMMEDLDKVKEKKKTPVKVMPTISPNAVIIKSENNGNVYKSMGISVGPPPVYSSGVYECRCE